MATYSQSSTFGAAFFDANGVPLSGGTLDAFLAGTTTPTAMYTDSAGTSAGVSITLNARGEPEVSGNTVVVWLDNSKKYKFVLKSSSGSTIWTFDDIEPKAPRVINPPDNQLILTGPDVAGSTNEYRYSPTVIYRNYTQASVISTVDETILYQYTLPVRALSVKVDESTWANDRSLRIRSWGVLRNESGGASGLTVRVYLGAEVAFASGIPLPNLAINQPFLLDVTISARDGSPAQQSSTGTFTFSTNATSGNEFAATSIALIQSRVNMTQDTTAASLIKMTCEPDDNSALLFLKAAAFDITLV